MNLTSSLTLVLLYDTTSKKSSQTASFGNKKINKGVNLQC